jgi:hypothetical protein
MQRLRSHQSVTHLGYLRSILEEAGIGCVIKNERLSGALGEIPFLECWPELWVTDTNDLRRAERLIAMAEADAEPGEAWQCSECGEMIEGQFAACWQCGNAEQGEGHRQPAP